jgi:hypothetical protein
MFSKLGSSQVKENIMSKVITSSTKKLNAFKAPLVQEKLSHLMGQILTIADASLAEHQKKAVKDLIRHAFDDTHDWFLEYGLKSDAIPGLYGSELVQYDATYVSGPLVE